MKVDSGFTLGVDSLLSRKVDSGKMRKGDCRLMRAVDSGKMRKGYRWQALRGYVTSLEV